MTLMLRLLPASLFRRIKPPPRRLTLLSWRATACTVVMACVVASCGEDSAEPVITTDTTATTTDISSTHTTGDTTTDTTVDTTGTPTTTGTMSTVDTTTTAGMTTTVDTTGTAGMTTTLDTATVDPGTPTTTATTSDTTVDTAGPTTADTTMVDTTMVDTTTADTTSDTTDTAAPTLTFGEIDYLILTRSCANVICHTGAPYFEPVLSGGGGGDLHETLMTWTVEECGGQPLVVPGDPENSALIKLIRRECEPIVVEATGEVFESMPPFCTDPICIHQDDYDALVAWINAGAPE